MLCGGQNQSPDSSKRGQKSSRPHLPLTPQGQRGTTLSSKHASLPWSLHMLCFCFVSFSGLELSCPASVLPTLSSPLPFSCWLWFIPQTTLLRHFLLRNAGERSLDYTLTCPPFLCNTYWGVLYKRWKKPISPSRDEWINKMQYINAVE